MIVGKNLLLLFHENIPVKKKREKKKTIAQETNYKP
jgi:hypothetical protein